MNKSLIRHSSEWIMRIRQSRQIQLQTTNHLNSISAFFARIKCNPKFPLHMKTLFNSLLSFSVLHITFEIWIFCITLWVESIKRDLKRRSSSRIAVQFTKFWKLFYLSLSLTLSSISSVFLRTYNVDDVNFSFYLYFTMIDWNAMNT